MPPSSRHQAPGGADCDSATASRYIPVRAPYRLRTSIQTHVVGGSRRRCRSVVEWFWPSGRARLQVSASSAHVFWCCSETDTTDSARASPQDLSETDYPPTRSGSARRSTTHITLHSRHISLEHSAASKLRQDQTVNATSSSRPQPSMPRQPHRSRLIQDHAQPSASSPVACRPYTSS